MNYNTAKQSLTHYNFLKMMNGSHVLQLFKSLTADRLGLGSSSIHILAIDILDFVRTVFYLKIRRSLLSQH